MKSNRSLWVVAFWLGVVLSAPATTYYVNVSNSVPVSPFTNWVTAATNIQDAVDASTNGDLILVTNGVYQFGGRAVSGFGLVNRVTVDKAVTVQSVNGPSATTIQGNPAIGANAVRCVYLTNNATLIGFTVTGGATRYFYVTANDTIGGGIWCASSNNVVVSNCVITANACTSLGGGVYGGMLLNCTLANNSATNGGGAAFSVLKNCILTGNMAGPGILGAVNYPGSPTFFGGGAYNSQLFNCAVYNNLAGIEGGGVYGGSLVNCTVTGNSATEFGGVFEAHATNSIIYYNVAYYDVEGVGRVITNFDGPPLVFCCTTSELGGPFEYVGCVTNDPVLASVSHLSLYSPCIGAGTNSVTSGVDIDGEPWANPPSIGCDELYPGNVTGNFSVGITTASTNLPPGYARPFQADISGPVNASKWDFGDGTVISNAPYVTHAWAATGDYPVTLTAYNDTYPTGQTATVIMHISVPMLLYVSMGSTNPILPYVDWSTAATNIQDAVDVAGNGALILVTNAPPAPLYQTNGYVFGGRIVYGSLLNRVAITKPVTVQSVGGPAATLIVGSPTIGDSACRCVYMTNGAVLSGFTLASGATRNAGDEITEQSGGAVWCESTNATITNCVILKNSAWVYGGGIYSGTVINSTVATNSASSGGFSPAATNGGGAAFGSVLLNCLIFSNLVSSGNVNYGGGADSCVLSNCTLVQNSCGNGGGAASSTLINCTLTNNFARGGFGGGAYSCLLTNCLLVGNVATNTGYGGGMYGGLANGCTFNGNFANNGGAAAGDVGSVAVLNYCTISSNIAGQLGSGVYGKATFVGSSLSNCILNNCTLSANGGTGTAYASTLNNCSISNQQLIGPLIGGHYAVLGGVLNNCTISGNKQGGARGNNSIGPLIPYCTLNNCIISGNTNTSGGAGSAGAFNCILNNCAIIGNTNYVTTGGGAGAYASTLNNCLVVSNSALPVAEGQGLITQGGGVNTCTLNDCIVAYNSAETNGGGAYASTMVNCTIVGNSAMVGAGVCDGSLKNCIVYFNNNDNYASDGSAAFSLSYCCTFPLTNGVGNITNAPLFLNLAGGDFHLQTNSPCINSGKNSFVTNSTDFDGNPRISGGTVDIGAYEFQNPPSIISYAWLQQYGFPTDGSADFADPDGDGMSNYAEWKAGTNPTNALSVLKMNSATNHAPGLAVTWQSVTNVTYYLQRASDLTAVFSTIQSNIVGQAVTTSCTDASATNAVPYFYRVGVQ